MKEQLEEGEIIDDDDDDDYNFEDISDNSIIDYPNTANGKFVSSNERLRALSLSSVSDTDIPTIDNYNGKHRKKSSYKHLGKRYHHHHQQQQSLLFDTDSSDTDIYYQDDDLKDKLKEAIRISDDDDNNNITRSSLQARLKLNFNRWENKQEQLCDNHGRIDDSELENLRLAALKSTEYNNKHEINDRNDRIDDSELENLRLEALKTAVLNKFQKRKRRKALQENHIDNNQQNNDNNNNNQENSDKIILNHDDDDDDDENTIKKQCNEQNIDNNQIIDFEEDEDLLRASLLANLAKKIKTTSDELEIPVVIPVKQQIPQRSINNNHKPILIKNITKIPDPSKLVVNNLTKIELPNRKIIPIKPLIINLKDDSDSDDDYEYTQQRNAVINDTTTKPLDDLVEKFLKEQRAKVETQQLLKNQLMMTQFRTKQHQLQQQKTKFIRNNNTNIIEKSAMKLLPKSAQLEYQELLKRLKTAEIKQKILKRNHLNRIEEMKNIEPKGNQLETNNGKINEKHSDAINNKHLTALQKTLKEIRIQNNGSLQMKSKYQDLTPIIRKINEARIERKKYENVIKQLLNDLKEARTNLWTSHERFSLHVKQLIDRKTMIDKRNVKIDNNPIVNNSAKMMVDESKVEENKIAIITSTQICTDKNDICEDMEICTNDDEQEEQEQQQSLHIDIVDPNDIDQIYKKRPIKSYIPEYISPLTNYERYNNVDPYGIMCPYEVNGSCRDSECCFKHFLKIQDNAR